MDFSERMQPVSLDTRFDLSEEGFFVWCGSVTKGPDGRYYLYFSFWPHEAGFEAWVTHSRIGYAVSDGPTGPFTYGGIALDGAGGASWDRDCVHNPAVLQVGDTYYLYYMGNYGDGSFWDHRNHQRVGVAWSKDPKGPFHRMDHPLIDVRPGFHDSLMTSNPSVCLAPDGSVRMIYKAVSDEGVLPKGGAVVCGMAEAPHPLGPFTRSDHPILTNPENPWSVEDPFLWYEEGRFYVLAKDFQGYFTGSERGSVALFESEDGWDFRPSAKVLAYNLQLHLTDGAVIPLANMERPQMYLENGRPVVLCCACAYPDDPEKKRCFNIQIPITEEVSL